MPKIIFLSDLHGQLSTLDLYTHLKPDLFVLCGDLEPKRDLVTRTPVLYTHGNHDNLSVLRRRMGDTWVHLSVVEACGLRVLGIGGVFDGQRNILHGPENLTPESAVQSLIRETGRVDLIFSHDAPTLADPRGTAALNPLLDRFKPTHWIFGHLHDRIDLTVQGTRLIGLHRPVNDGQDFILEW